MHHKIVKIKTWKHMESEFGLDNDGDIRAAAGFTKEMEEAIPIDRLISITEAAVSPPECRRYDWDGTYYFISDDMIDTSLATFETKSSIGTINTMEDLKSITETNNVEQYLVSVDVMLKLIKQAKR